MRGAVWAGPKWKLPLTFLDFLWELALVDLDDAEGCAEKIRVLNLACLKCIDEKQELMNLERQGSSEANMGPESQEFASPETGCKVGLCKTKQSDTVLESVIEKYDPSVSWELS